MKTTGRNTVGFFLGVALAVGALIVFGATIVSGIFPGKSADLVARFGGLFPLMSPDFPLFRALFRCVRVLPFGTVALRVNALSVLFGAVGVGLLYHLVSTGVLWLVNPNDLSERRGIVLSRLAGTIAAVGLCFSSPYWVVATRAHNAAFNVMLLLAAVTVLMTYARARGTGWLYLLSFLWGLGTVEYASFIILAPLAILTVLLLMWQKGQFRPLPITTALLCGLLGLSLYLVAAWGFYGSTGYEVRGYPGYWKVIWFMWRDQYRLIARSLPREGWLLVLLTTGVPWLVGLGVAKKGFNDEPGWSDWLLHLVLSAVCGIVILSLGVAPWTLLGYARLLVLPYVLTAALTGYLVAYWLRQALAWGEMPQGKLRTAVVRVSGFVLLMFLTVAVLAVPVRNRGVADASGAETLSACAGMMVESAAENRQAEERSWMVSDSSMDDLLRVAAYDKGVRLEVINLAAGSDPGYGHYLSTRVESARMKNLARIGAMPLLSELLTGEKARPDRVHVFAVPDIWTMAGLVPVPDRLVTHGVASLEDVDLEALYAKHVAFWDEMVPRLQAAAGSKIVGDPVARLAMRLLRQAALMANNLGVCIEDKGGAADRAFVCYTRALEIAPDNVSALLNANRMIEQGFQSAQAEALKALLEELKASDRRYDILGLSQVHGYVREPGAFSGVARTWALTGQPRMAARSLQRAMDLVDDEQQSMLKADLAGLYLGERRDAESEALYYELLVEDPENQRALIGLARIEALKGNFEEGRSLLARAKAAGVPSGAIAMERAVQCVLQKNDAAARKELEWLIVEDETRIQVWSLLVDVLLRAEDWAALERAADRLRTLEGGSGLAAELSGMLALRRADLAGARRYYAEALRAQPSKVSLLDRAMRLDLTAMDLPAAEKRARSILELDIGHALANYVMGAARLAEDERALAEDAFRRSLERERLPQALNDLAWLLSQKGELAEAEGLAREAVEVQPGMFQAWDTLGEVLVKQGKMAEAEEALQKALSLSSDVGTLLHMAQLQHAKGDVEHAREIVLMIADKTGRLSSEAKADYDRLQRSLGM